MGDDPFRNVLGHDRADLEKGANACLTPAGLVNEAARMEVDRLTDMCLIDAAQLHDLCPDAPLMLLNSLASAMTAFFPEFAIDTPFRICHFLAQTATESAGFHALTEYPSHYASSKSKYKGRGILQLTGHQNYKFYGRLVQVPLEEYPELAALPQLSVLIACNYWDQNKLNRPADKDDIEGITRAVNGSKMLGLASRKRYLAQAKTIWARGLDPAMGTLRGS